MRRPFALLLAAALATACTAKPVQQAAVPDVAIPTASSPPPPAEVSAASDQDKPASRKAQRGLEFKLASVNGAGQAHIEAGQVHVIHIWATFCEPCKLSLPMLQKLSEQYGGSGVRVLALAEDDESDGVSTFASTFKITFPVALDAGSAVAKALKAKTLPCTFVVDRSGEVRFVQEGYAAGDEEKLKEQIKSLL